jgi:hypothetical protein
MNGEGLRPPAARTYYKQYYERYSEAWYPGTAVPSRYRSIHPGYCVCDADFVQFMNPNVEP